MPWFSIGRWVIDVVRLALLERCRNGRSRNSIAPNTYFRLKSSNTTPDKTHTRVKHQVFFVVPSSVLARALAKLPVYRLANRLRMTCGIRMRRSKDGLVRAAGIIDDKIGFVDLVETPPATS